MRKGGTDSEDLQEWTLKFSEDSKRLRNSVDTFDNWLANGNLPWAAYCEFMSGCLIALDKQPVICLVGVRETWRHLFSKIFLKVTEPEATMLCQDDQLCSRLEALISWLHVLR